MRFDGCGVISLKSKDFDRGKVNTISYVRYFSGVQFTVKCAIEGDIVWVIKAIN